MTVVGEVIGDVILAAETAAGSDGLTGLSNFLNSTGYWVGAADTFAEQHPYEAAAGFLAGIVVTTFLLPEEIALGATTLAESAVMQEGAVDIGLVLSGLGIDTSTAAGLAQTAISDASSIMANIAIQQATEHSVNSFFQAANSLSNYLTENGAQPFLTLQDSPTANGGSQLTAAFASGSSASIDYSGPLGTGAPISGDIENSNGTSTLTTYNSDGSSVTTAYTGANGTGATAQIDQVSADGSSRLTVYGSSSTTVENFDPTGKEINSYLLVNAGSTGTINADGTMQNIYLPGNETSVYINSPTSYQGEISVGGKVDRIDLQLNNVDGDPSVSYVGTPNDTTQIDLSWLEPIGGGQVGGGIQYAIRLPPRCRLRRHR